jgi:aminocarboxymuconate-semialdehyde decarboxylase
MSGCACGIDVHAHVIPHDFPSYLGNALPPDWPSMVPALAYPTDVGLAAASVLSSNLIARHPTLKIAFSHGGGTLAMLLPRLEQARTVFPALKDAMPASASEQARSLYYDTLVFDAPTLDFLLARFGAGQLMIGTDYPFAFRDKAPVGRIAAACADPAVRAQLTTYNAARFLGIGPGAPQITI